MAQVDSICGANENLASFDCNHCLETAFVGTYTRRMELERQCSAPAMGIASAASRESSSWMKRRLQIEDMLCPFQKASSISVGAASTITTAAVAALDLERDKAVRDYIRGRINYWIVDFDRNFAWDYRKPKLQIGRAHV